MTKSKNRPTKWQFFHGNNETSSKVARTVAPDSSQKKVVLVHSYGPQNKKKIILVHSYGLHNNDKVKESINEVGVLPRKPSARQGCSCWVLKNRNRKVKKLE